MKCLVTGGAGFVGSHLIEQLLDDNHSVICFDDFSTGKTANLSNVGNQINIIEGDIRDSKSVRNVIQDVDCVFHLAAQISVSRSTRDPRFDASVNIDGTLNLLEAICNSSVKRLIYISTGGAIYGEPKYLPASEETQENPISPYGLSKLVAEKYIHWFGKIYDLSYTIIRPANIYGPRQDPLGEAGVISIFLGAIINNSPLNIFGDGKDTRDYIFVKDIADICIRAMNSSQIDVFNAGSGKQTDLLELIEIIEKVTESKVQKKLCDPRPGDVNHISLDSKKAIEKLNWDPNTDLFTGIKQTWEWFVSSNTR
ncbi:MAG: NAD-dependent epimerase/dehydratase family protein [Candidatus Hodarchaeales archaeon]|jgi:UDP-glucose 4-epimerase